MTTDAFPVIDAQVHAYERDHPGRPWAGDLAGPAEVTGAMMVAAMDEVGVDGALLVSPWTMYRYDASYACEVQKAYPQRFALIRPFDFSALDVAEQVAEWARVPGAVGARLVLLHEAPPAPDHPGVDAILRSSAVHGLPVNVLCWDELGWFETLARNHPETQLVIDHLGLRQPFVPPVPEAPFAEIQAVAALARYDNVVIKITGAGTLSHEGFPYPDIWPQLEVLFDAFGFERCLWGTDWTRAVNFLTYKEGVEAFRITDFLSDDERRTLMGGSLTRVYGWSPGGSD